MWEDSGGCQLGGALLRANLGYGNFLKPSWSAVALLRDSGVAGGGRPRGWWGARQSVWMGREIYGGCTGRVRKGDSRVRARRLESGMWSGFGGGPARHGRVVGKGAPDAPSGIGSHAAMRRCRGGLGNWSACGGGAESSGGRRSGGAGRLWEGELSVWMMRWDAMPEGVVW